MPSAASAKLEKQASGNQTEPSADNNNANTPIRQALVIIEHKIRNLEKRKTKLESYRSIQSSGKELSADQKAAVSKYDEVAQSLEFARELSKQMLQLATTAEKEQKRQVRKEAASRAQAETIKIREVLTIQNILSNFYNNSQVREDFLNGINGATKLEEDDIKVLEKFYVDIQVKRQTTPDDVPFSVSAQKAAEYLSLTVDGRPKQYEGTTFDNIRRILNIIQECGYLDRSGKFVESNVEESPEEDTEIDQGGEDDSSRVMSESNVEENVETRNVDVASSNIPVQHQQPQQQRSASPVSSVIPEKIDVPKFASEAPSAAAVPAPSFPQQSQPLLNTQIPSQPPPQIPIPVVQTQIVAASVAQAQVAQGPPVVVANPNPANALHPGHFPPTTVRAVEQAYYKQHQYIQQMRPLAEVIGSGNFFFLQDSELDSPDLVPTGFTPNEGQNQNQNMTAGGNIPTSGSNSTGGLPNQSNIVPQQQTQVQSQQQQQPQLPTIPQPAGMSQQKSQQQTPAPNTTPIPTQTFTNQSFPIVPPPSTMFPPQSVQNPNEVPNSQPQIPVFAAGPPLPIPQMVATAVAQSPVVVSITPSAACGSAQHTGSAPKNVENQPQQGIITNQPTLITGGPSVANVPLPGFTSVVSGKFPPAPTPPMVVGMHQVSQKPPLQDNYEKLQKPIQTKILSENQIHKKIDDVKERLDRMNDNPTEWDAKDNLSKPQRSTKKDEESNQWSNEVANSVKTNEWNNSSYDNQTESTNWNSSQNDGGYGNRNRNSSFGGSNRTGGNRGIRGSSGNGNGVPGSGGLPPNGYRGGRSNSSYQQQQNRNSGGVYFRNNDNSTGGGYYQNQNGVYNTGGEKRDGSNSYGGGGNMNTSYRPRGGPIPSSNRQPGGGRPTGGPPNSGPSSGGGAQRSRPNGGVMSTNPNRPGGVDRSNTSRTVSYGNSRGAPNVRQQQQQDVNA